MTRDEAERKALDLCLIAGNHLGTHRQPYWPHAYAGRDEAMKLITTHGMKEYDMWCAWSLIIRAGRLLRGAKIIPLHAA